MDSNLAATREVLRVVDELLMNPVDFHVDHPSCHIKGHSVTPTFYKNKILPT
jgi:hypothetical protein